MALIELRYRNEPIAKCGAAAVGYEPGSPARFLISGEVPRLDLPEQYTLVIDGMVYPIKDLRLGPDGKSVTAELA